MTTLYQVLRHTQACMVCCFDVYTYGPPTGNILCRLKHAHCVEPLPLPKTDALAALPPSAEDKKLGISIRFVRSYDVIADKRFTLEDALRWDELMDRLSRNQAVRTLEHAMDYLFVTGRKWGDEADVQATSILAAARERVKQDK